MAVLLAQTTKGLSAFYAPLRRRIGNKARSSVSLQTLTTETPTHSSETNGVRIQRLKNKLGAKGVPTAELELKKCAPTPSAKKARASRRSAPS